MTEIETVTEIETDEQGEKQVDKHTDMQTERWRPQIYNWKLDWLSQFNIQQDAN